MRKILLGLAVVLLALTFMSCSKSGQQVGSNVESTAADFRQQQSVNGTIDMLAYGAAPTYAQEPYEPATRSTIVPDIDFTTISGPLVYSLVYNMMKDPEKFLGKTIKMGGAFTTTVDSATGERYYACIVKDAGACCAQGIEFRLKGEHSFPEDYPNMWQEFQVIGVFTTYTIVDDQYFYCTISDAEYV